MKTPKRRQSSTDTEGCRRGRRPSSQVRARYADLQAQAALRRMLPRF